MTAHAAMPAHIHIENCNQSYLCADGVDVLRGMECLGRKGIPVGCRGGGCGVCKVKVLAGPYRTGKMSRSCVSVDEEREGIVLACKLFADGDLSIEAIGKMARAVLRAAPVFPWSDTAVSGPPR